MMFEGDVVLYQGRNRNWAVQQTMEVGLDNHLVQSRGLWHSWFGRRRGLGVSRRECLSIRIDLALHPYHISKGSYKRKLDLLVDVGRSW